MVSKAGKNGVHDAKIVHCPMCLNVRIHKFNFKSLNALFLTLTISLYSTFSIFFFITSLLSTNDSLDENTMKIQNLLNIFKVLADVKSRYISIPLLACFLHQHKPPLGTSYNFILFYFKFDCK